MCWSVGCLFCLVTGLLFVVDDSIPGRFCIGTLTDRLAGLPDVTDAFRAGFNEALEFPMGGIEGKGRRDDAPILGDTTDRLIGRSWETA